MVSVSIESAQANLPDLINALKPGEALLITSGEYAVARLLPAPPALRKRRVAGSAKGELSILQEDVEPAVPGWKFAVDELFP